MNAEKDRMRTVRDKERERERERRKGEDRKRHGNRYHQHGTNETDIEREKDVLMDERSEILPTTLTEAAVMSYTER